MGTDWDWASFDLGRLSGWRLLDELTLLGLALAWAFTRAVLVRRRGLRILLPRPFLRLTRTQLWRRNTTNMYKTLPLRMASRVWGYVNEVPLWPPLRRPLLGLFVHAFGCNMEEAVEEDLSAYRNLSELFNRKLKDSARPIAEQSALVSPADGFVQGYGLIEDGMVEQVKGINYPLQDFLGPEIARYLNQQGSDSQPLHYCTLYLAPGDYHAFHSPAQWTAEKRIHFSGELLSVSGWVMERVADIMTLNERVLLSGQWEHGFFSYTAVGATNVGNIVIDEVSGWVMERVADIMTLNERVLLSGQWEHGFFSYTAVGATNVGNIVIDEAPRGFRFLPEKGSRIRFGEALGEICPPERRPAA